MSNSKDKYKVKAYEALKKSAGRLNTFIEAEIDQFITRELLIMLDRIHVLNPDAYGDAIKGYKLGEMKRERGLCADDGCYNHLSPPLEALKMQNKDATLAQCMEWYCPEHAKFHAENNKDLDDDIQEN